MSLALAGMVVAGAMGWSRAQGTKGASFEAQSAAEDAGQGAPVRKACPVRRSLLGRLFCRKRDRPRFPAGYRAVTVPVQGLELAGLRAGDRVDVLAVFDARMADDRKEKLSATILQNARVLAVAQPADAGGKGGATLMLNPLEAQYAALAFRQADLSLILRPEGDEELHPMEMTSFRKFFR